eukprot:1046577-Prorocentrum_minimum.AAC.1
MNDETVTRVERACSANTPATVVFRPRSRRPKRAHFLALNPKKALASLASVRRYPAVRSPVLCAKKQPQAAPRSPAPRWPPGSASGCTSAARRPGTGCTAGGRRRAPPPAGGKRRSDWSGGRGGPSRGPCRTGSRKAPPPRGPCLAPAPGEGQRVRPEGGEDQSPGVFH